MIVSTELPGDDSILCLPPRTALKIAAAALAVLGLFHLLAPVSDDALLLSGGFDQTTKRLSFVVGAVALPVALYGLLSVQESHSAGVRMLAWALLARAVAVLFLWYGDAAGPLAECESARHGLLPAARADGTARFNPTLSHVAFAHLCAQYRTLYTVRVAADVTLGVYVGYHAWKTAWTWDVRPKFLIRWDQA